MPNSLSSVLGAGNSPLSSTSICGTSSLALTATGSTQGTALQLVSNSNEVTTTAASTGVLLPANMTPSDEVVVSNYGANSLSVYPPTGESINAGAANAAFSVAANKTVYLIKTNATRWSGILSA